MSHSLNANGMNGSSSPAGIREGTRVVLKEITSTMHNSPPTTHRVCRKSSSNSPIVKGEHEVKVQFTREFVDVGPPPSRPESPASTSSFQSLASTLSAKSCVEPPDTPQKIADTSYTNKDICDLDDLISACGNIKLNDQSQVSGNTLLDSTLTITACDESFSHAGGPEDQTGETFVSALGNLSADKEFQEPTSQHTEISPNAVDSNVTQTFTSQSESNHESGRITDSSFTEISNNCNTSNENSSHALHTSVENIPFVQSNESTSQCNRSWNHISESKEGAPVSNPTINRSLPTLNRTSEFDPVKPALSLNTTENSSLNCSQEPQNIQTGTTDKLNLTQDIWKTENDETKNTIPEDINSKLNETRELSATEITVNSSTTVESHSELIGHDKAILPSDIEITAPTIISPTRIPCSGKSPIQESRSPIDSKVVSASEDVQKSEVSPIIVAEKLSKEVVSDNSEIVKLPTSKETVPIVSTVPILQTRTVDSQVSEQIVPEQKISQCPTSPNRSQSELPIGQKQELSKNIEPFSLTDSTGSETLNASEESTLTHSNIETDSRVVLQSSGNAVRENPVGGDPNSVVENINVSQRHSPAANGTRTEGFTINEENRNEEITTDISQLIPPAVNTVPVHCSNHRVPENQTKIYTIQAVQTSQCKIDSPGFFTEPQQKEVPHNPNHYLRNVQELIDFNSPKPVRELVNLTPYPGTSLTAHANSGSTSETFVLDQNDAPNQNHDRTLTLGEESFHSAESDIANEPYTAFQPKQQSTELNSDIDFKQYQLAAQVLAEEFHNKSLELAEEPDHIFHGDSDLQLNAASFDYLLSRTTSKNPVRDLGRESLYVKFDPLVGAVNMLPQGPTHALDTEENAKNNIPSQPLNTPKRNPALAALDRLLIYSPATCTPNKMDEPPKIEELVAEVKQEFIPIVDPNMVKELELVRSTVVELENQIENQKKEFQQELDKQKAKYETELAHKAQDNEKLALVIDEYEKSISRLVADRGRESVSLEQETAKLQEELQTTNHHLNNTEAAFNDVHLKYERLKGVVAAYKSNESVLKDSIQENVATIKQLEARYDQLKSHAMAQLEKANLELDTLRKQNESETVKLQAMIRKAELKSNSLAEIVEQKIKENKQLTEILDEVIARVGHKSDD